MPPWCSTISHRPGSSPVRRAPCSPEVSARVGALFNCRSYSSRLFFRSKAVVNLSGDFQDCEHYRGLHIGAQVKIRLRTLNVIEHGVPVRMPLAIIRSLLNSRHDGRAQAPYFINGDSTVLGHVSSIADADA